MGTLKDLRIPLDEMTEEDLRDHIRFIRDDRKKFKITAKAPKAKRVKKASGLLKSFKGLTAEERALLLTQLEGK
jgi:hypothetical protein